MVFVPKTSFKIYSSLKNQNTYIVTGVRTQLRLEQVDRHVLFLGWEMHLNQKSKSFGKKDSQHQMKKFCTKQRRGLCNCSSSVFNIKAGAFALVSKLFLLLVRYGMHLPFTLKWAITFLETHFYKSEYLTNFRSKGAKEFCHKQIRAYENFELRQELSSMI